MGIPTIATSVCGFPDIGIPEKTGFLVPPYSPKAIADAIEQVICYPDKAKQLAHNGQAYVREMLNSKNTSKAVLSFYREIFNR